MKPNRNSKITKLKGETKITNSKNAGTKLINTNIKPQIKLEPKKGKEKTTRTHINEEHLNNAIKTEQNLDYKQIDDILKSQADDKKLYSKTYIEKSYTPLSQNEKKKVLEDMSTTSDKRLKLYCTLFKEIKSQINLISDNLTSSQEMFNNMSPITTNIAEEPVQALDYSIELNPVKRSRSRSKKTNKHKKISPINSKGSKNKGKPKEHNMVPYKKVENFNVSKFQDDCNLSDEENCSLTIPIQDYKSNNIKEVDYQSNPKAYSLSVSDNNFQVRGFSDRKYSNLEYSNEYNQTFHQKNRSQIKLYNPRVSFRLAKMELDTNVTSRFSHFSQLNRYSRTAKGNLTNSNSLIHEDDLKISLSIGVKKTELDAPDEVKSVST